MELAVAEMVEMVVAQVVVLPTPEEGEVEASGHLILEDRRQAALVEAVL